MLPAVLLAVVYLIWSPPSADLAAQTFRTELFEAHGFEVWSNAWYGGIHLPGYSLLFPPLASVIGIRLVGAISVVAAAGLFARARSPPLRRPRTAGDLAVGLGGGDESVHGPAHLRARRRDWRRRAARARPRPPVASALLAALTACASPVAGLFLAFAGGVLRVTGRRRDGLLLGAAALGATGLVALAFPTGGVEPFVGNTFKLITAATLILVVRPARARRAASASPPSSTSRCAWCCSRSTRRSAATRRGSGR